jgi:hypothetical protein
MRLAVESRSRATGRERPATVMRATLGRAGARLYRLEGIDPTGDPQLLRCAARGSRGFWPVERLLLDPH